MILFRSLSFLTCILLSTTCFSQKSKEAFFAFKEDWSPINDLNKATYFMHQVKENDSTFVCRYYQKMGPMVKCETYKDEYLEIPHGRFAWYNSLGNLDSTGMVNEGKKDGYWEFWQPNGKLGIEILFEKGRRIWTKNYLTKIMYFTDGRPNEPLSDDPDKYDEYEEDEKPAEFKGGVDNWVRYLEKTLETPGRFKDIVGGGGKGTVIVCFYIDKTGNLYDPYIQHSIEWSVDMETLRVLKKSPPWTPAYKNGKPVIYRHKQSITHSIIQL